jgi:hypothetical protein
VHGEDGGVDGGRWWAAHQRSDLEVVVTTPGVVAATASLGAPAMAHWCWLSGAQARRRFR